jgi:eukaryotic-like serine/threonine-protein kinase
MDLAPDIILNNRYRIIRTLGHGGMGAVYLAYDTSLDHQVAVKHNRNLSAQATSGFLREARLLASLHHPNLPRVIDYFIIGSDQYLVMDYIAGDDLELIISKYGPQNVNTVLKWANQLTSALDFLHNQQPQVIHRDIKPANIKITPEGEIILVDFGIAKSVDTTSAATTGTKGYTPGFAPPEQYGSAPTGPFTDQYSLACTLYNLLTGQKPVDSVERVLGKAASVPLGSLNPGIPVNIQQAIEKAMSLRPEDRFGTVSEFQQALQNPNFRFQPRPQSAPTSMLKQQARRKSWTWLAIAGGLALLFLIFLGVAGGGYYFLSQNKSTETPKPAGTATGQVSIVATAPLPTPSSTTTSTPKPSATSTPVPTHTPTITPTSTALAVGKGGVIAFSSNRADGKIMQIWTMLIMLDNEGKVNATELKQLTTGGGDKNHPAWSPDGRKLLYVADGGVNNGKDIWVMDFMDPQKPPENLSNRSGDDTDPAWSPDGKTIAFNNNFRGSDLKLRQIVLINPDGSDSYQLDRLGYEEYSPAWSPDGTRLLLTVFDSGNRYLRMRLRNNIYAPTKLPLGTSRPGYISPTPYPGTAVPFALTPVWFDQSTDFGQLGQIEEAAWAPNDNLVAYTRIQGALRQIYTTDPKIPSFKKNLLSKGGNIDYAPAWSPDSQWIVFTSERDGNSEIYVMTSAGQLATRLTVAAGKDIQAAWQPPIK